MKLTSLPKILALIVIAFVLKFSAVAQNFERFFPSKDLTSVGVYYYPEHWDSTQ